jgi:hypothetical protein
LRPAGYRLDPESLDRKSKDIFARWVKAGMDPEDLAERLGVIPQLPYKSVPLFSGRSGKTIKDFWKQIERWADKIEEANERGILSEVEICALAEARGRKVPALIPEKFTQMLDTFHRLPGHLRAYAAFWRNRRPKDDNLQRLAIGMLIRAVDETVGTPSYSDVSHLLDAAFDAAKQKPSISLDSDNLRDYYVGAYKRAFGAKPRTARKKEAFSSSLPTDDI